MKTLSFALLLALSPLALGGTALAGTDDQCADGLDNDEDGWTDDEDPDCILGGDEELGYGGDECNDGEDNDEDGDIDAEDSDCTSATDDEDGEDDGTDTDTDTDGDGDSGDDGGTDTYFDEGTKLSESTDEKGGFGCVENSAFLLLLPLPLVFRRKHCCSEG